MRRIQYALAAVMFAAAPTLAEVPLGAPTTDEIIHALVPDTAPHTRSTKGIKVIPGAEPSKPAIDLQINFAFDSADLQPDALQTLKRLGEALQDRRLAEFKFLIAGHTDARGSADYNQVLSERRANTVRQHLMFFYDIPTARLAAIGYGKTRLLDPQRPEEGANRRVQIVNEGR